jgi:hypothetical protein
MCQNLIMTRRDWLRFTAMVASFPSGVPRAEAQTAPEGFRVYTEAPRLFLRPQRLRLLRRERERRSLRWDQFETLWGSGIQFPEFGWTAALRYQIAQDAPAGSQAVAWAVNATPVSAGAQESVTRQIALIADWCEPLMAAADKSAIFQKLERALAQNPATLAGARTKTLAAVAISEARPDAAEKALREVYEGFWLGTFIPGLRDAKIHVPNADANAMLELMHAFRDNLNFDLRVTFGRWFKDYPVTHILAHYPEPFPGSENEYRIPADPQIDERGPDVTKAELAMVAFDSNAPETQLLQGFLMNDRFLMRGPLGMSYELLWADPYQPGLSYYHAPQVVHDEIGGELYVRSTWEDDAAWLGFFAGRLQLFANGAVVEVDPKAAHEPMDLLEASVFFANQSMKFKVPVRKKQTEPNDDQPAAGSENEPFGDVFVVGLEAKRRYHVEADSFGMLEAVSDAGGIIYLPGMPSGAEVRVGLAPSV